jgi:hypothetical protein
VLREPLPVHVKESLLTFGMNPVSDCPLLATLRVSLFVGVDAGIKHSLAAVVGVVRAGHALALALHRLWRPSPEAPLDLEQTIDTLTLDAT